MNYTNKEINIPDLFTAFCEAQGIHDTTIKIRIDVPPAISDSMSKRFIVTWEEDGEEKVFASWVSDPTYFNQMIDICQEWYTYHYIFKPNAQLLQIFTHTYALG